MDNVEEVNLEEVKVATESTPKEAADSIPEETIDLFPVDKSKQKKDESKKEDEPEKKNKKEKKEKKEKKKKGKEEEQPENTSALEKILANNEAEAQAKAAAEAEKAAKVEEESKVVEESPIQLSKEERKLRKKYKLDSDDLLSNNDVVPGFVIAKNEKVVRIYNCLECRKGEGTICLTNKRLLANANGRAEVPIENVTGIKFSRYTRFSIFKFLLAAILLGGGLFAVLLPFFKENLFGNNLGWYQYWFNYLFIAGGTLFMILSFPVWAKVIRKSFYFYIYAKQDAPFIEYKSVAYAKREAKGKSVYKYTVAKANKESDKAARELGALILEVKGNTNKE